MHFPTISLIASAAALFFPLGAVAQNATFVAATTYSPSPIPSNGVMTYTLGSAVWTTTYTPSGTGSYFTPTPTPSPSPYFGAAPKKQAAAVAAGMVAGAAGIVLGL